MTAFLVAAVWGNQSVLEILLTDVRTEHTTPIIKIWGEKAHNCYTRALKNIRSQRKRQIISLLLEHWKKDEKHYMSLFKERSKFSYQDGILKVTSMDGSGEYEYSDDQLRVHEDLYDTKTSVDDLHPILVSRNRIESSNTYILYIEKKNKND